MKDSALLWRSTSLELRSGERLDQVKACDMVTSSFGEFFVVIAESAATLIGLLFVAVTVTKGSSVGSLAIGDFRAAASLIAFTNALVVSLFGLVPGTDIGYPALVMGVIGLFFVGAGVKTTLAQPPAQQRRRRQFVLFVSLLGVFGLEIVYGLRLINNPRVSGCLSVIGYVLISSLLIGIGRAWEQVGRWDAGLVSSLRRLLHPSVPDVKE